LPGAFGAFLPKFSDWMVSRSERSVALRRIELARQEMDFIKSWLEVVTELNSEQLNIKKQQAEEYLAALLGSVVISPEKEACQSSLSRLNLFYNILFYACSGFFLVLMFGTSIDDKTDEMSIETLFSAVYLLCRWLRFTLSAVKRRVNRL